MKILALECSASPCSVAIIDDEKLIGSSFENIKLTHSQTLMPMMENLLNLTKLNINDIDGFAISNGPGSFTGIRIGISAVKGLAQAKKLPTVGVSTLLSMAYNYKDTDCIICAVMDARCHQVYNALFDVSNGNITRLTDDRAIMCENLSDEIKKMSQNSNKCVIIVGDGTDIFYPYVENVLNVKKSDQQHRFQNAVSVAYLSYNMFLKKETTSPDELLPMYLRLPQAERELKLKKEGKN